MFRARRAVKPLLFFGDFYWNLLCEGDFLRQLENKYGVHREEEIFQVWQHGDFGGFSSGWSNFMSR